MTAACPQASKPSRLGIVRGVFGGEVLSLSVFSLWLSLSLSVAGLSVSSSISASPSLSVSLSVSSPVSKDMYVHKRLGRYV